MAAFEMNFTQTVKSVNARQRSQKHQNIMTHHVSVVGVKNDNGKGRSWTSSLQICTDFTVEISSD